MLYPAGSCKLQDAPVERGRRDGRWVADWVSARAGRVRSVGSAVASWVRESVNRAWPASSEA